MESEQDTFIRCMEKSKGSFETAKLYRIERNKVEAPTDEEIRIKLVII